MASQQRRFVVGIRLHEMCMFFLLLVALEIKIHIVVIVVVFYFSLVEFTIPAASATIAIRAVRLVISILRQLGLPLGARKEKMFIAVVAAHTA